MFNPLKVDKIISQNSDNSESIDSSLNIVE